MDTSETRKQTRKAAEVIGYVLIGTGYLYCFVMLWVNVIHWWGAGAILAYIFSPFLALAIPVISWIIEGTFPILLFAGWGAMILGAVLVSFAGKVNEEETKKRSIKPILIGVLVVALVALGILAQHKITGLISEEPDAKLIEFREMKQTQLRQAQADTQNENKSWGERIEIFERSRYLVKVIKETFEYTKLKEYHEFKLAQLDELEIQLLKLRLDVDQGKDGALLDYNLLLTQRQFLQQDIKEMQQLLE